MPEPITIPRHLGQPCWTDANLEATIRTVAAMGEESTSRFLATHAPIRNVRLGDTDTMLSDGQVFDRIVQLSARENVVLVHGAPGTGKSHLINWVKLRYDHAVDAGELTGVLPVLVRRRTGSLKDALEQLVEQLPDRFAKYLEPVRAAIDRISEREARKKLATELHLELGVRWEETGKPPLPRTIRHLADAFHAEGFGAWLCRDGGVIDRNIRQLISPSEIGDRGSFQPFTNDEFRIQDPRHRSAGSNTANVRRLIDEFDDGLEAAEEAAKLCNQSLRSALRELTGLGNAAFSTILRSIRQDLRKEGARLILLIEDVSTLSVLDDEVVNAVEPQDDASLCDLTSMLGMTEQAYKRLRENQYQRIAGSGLILSFPADATSTGWAGGTDDVDRFVARYLNATRLSDAQVAQIAMHRRAGGDVGLSACEDCLVRAACHQAFGSVTLGEAGIGLFPFRPGTAHYLLDHLDATQTGVRPTQRGLLDFVAKPVLRHVEALSQDNHHGLALPIKPAPPTDWQTLREIYLGGWPAAEQQRLRLLAIAWTRQTRATDVAADLQPLLAPFSLPDFSARTDRPPAALEKASAPAAKGETQPPTSPSPIDAAKKKKLADQLGRLERWQDGKRLESPGDFQDVLLRFLKSGLPVDDSRSPAVPAQRLLRDANRGSIRIEDSATQAARVGVVFAFPRSEATYDLLVALTRQAVLDPSGWSFPDAERYKRIVARWLRQNQHAMLEALDPEGLSTATPIKYATKFLCMASMIERRAALPSDTAAALAYVTSTSPPKLPKVLTAPLEKLYADLPDRRRALQEFVVQETSVPQGSSGGIVVIDPQVITAAITEARSDPGIVPLPSDYAANYWKSRYQALDGLKAWAELPAAIAAERTAIGDMLGKIDRTLGRYGYSATGADAGIASFLADTAGLVDLLRSAFQWPADGIGFFKTDRLIDRGESFAYILQSAASVADGEKESEVLLFDPDDLLTVDAAVTRCAALIDRASDLTDDKLEHLSGEGDPDAIQAEIIAALTGIVGEVVA